MRCYCGLVFGVGGTTRAYEPARISFLRFMCFCIAIDLRLLSGCITPNMHCWMNVFVLFSQSMLSLAV